MNRSKMTGRKTLKTLATILLLTMGWTFGGVGSALADWDDQSDELPGMDNSLTPVLIAGGVLLTLVLVLKAKKGGGDKSGEAATETGSESEKPGDGDGSYSPDDSDYLVQVMSTGTTSPSLPAIRPLAGVGQSSAVVGVSFGF